MRTLVSIGVVGLLAVWAAAPQAQQAQSAGCQRADTMVAQARQTTPSAAALPRLLTIYQEALAACPTHPEASNNAADTFERLGRYPEAIDAYKRAVAAYRAAGVAPASQALPIFGLADAYRKSGNTTDALYWYRKGLELDPSDTPSQAAVAELTRDDPKNLVGSRNITGALEGSRSPGVVAAAVTFDERVLPFSYDSAELLPGARAQLREMAYALFDVLGATRNLGVLAAGPVVAEIGGHADQRGAEPHNLELSRRRADAVAQALISTFRIPASRLSMVGYGTKRLLCTDNTEACYARNRRVEIRRP